MSPAVSILTFPSKLNFPRELHSGRTDFVCVENDVNQALSGMKSL